MGESSERDGIARCCRAAALGRGSSFAVCAAVRASARHERPQGEDLEVEARLHRETPRGAQDPQPRR
eukprot:4754393-Pyramimonas_sp.AAC.1